MSLDAKRQAMLDSCCYVYKKLFSELGQFEDLCEGIVSGIDSYSIVRDCFDPAIEKFGSTPPSSADTTVLVEDLLNKIGLLLSFNFSNNHDLLTFFQTFKKDIINSAGSLPNEIESFHEEAKKLSCTCYARHCNPKYRGHIRSSNLIITPSNNTTVSCMPQKTIGTSEVHFKFGTSDFNFMTYVNLPFYLYHEYLSHIHTASLFTESNYAQTSSFEDGWLIYVGHQEYVRYLMSGTDPVGIRHHKEHYITKYIYSITSGEKHNPYTLTGYDLAKEFDRIIGNELFYKISFLLSSVSYDEIPEYNPLQFIFLRTVKKWLKNLQIRRSEDVQEKIDLLTLAVDDEEPVKSLLDVMQ
jgi:hypothetical protein